MSKQKLQYMYLGFLLLVFSKTVLLPSIESTIEFGLTCVLVGFLTYFAPSDPREKRETEEINDKIAHLQEQLNKLFIKIGFKIGA
jgi:hypothetical protein